MARMTEASGSCSQVAAHRAFGPDQRLRIGAAEVIDNAGVTSAAGIYEEALVSGRNTGGKPWRCALER